MTEAELIARLDPNPEHDITNVYTEFYLLIARGEPEAGRALNELVKEVKPTSVEEFFGKWWGQL